MESEELGPIAASSPDRFSVDELLAIEQSVGEGPFLQVFENEAARSLVDQLVQDVVAQENDLEKTTWDTRSIVSHQGHLRAYAIRLGLASLAGFLQANVTGPVLEMPEIAEAGFLSAFQRTRLSHPPSNGKPSRKNPIEAFRTIAQRSLDIDGVSAYSYIPYVELFCLARFIFTSGAILPTELSDPLALHLSWTRLRIHLWHYKLLTQPSLGSGSLFTKSGRWTDVATLQELIEKSLLDAEASVLKLSKTGEVTGQSLWPRELRVQFRLEEANCHILLGNDVKARQALQAATDINGFSYTLSGALGKRTRYQENSISQLVVLAKSLRLTPGGNGDQDTSKPTPTALPLNDDTLLENIKFSNDEVVNSTSPLPGHLQDVKPDDQPELLPEDQIILLTEATLRDTFSPSDSLTLEEILPFAIRVIEDKAVNWQVYTQALLVRSRVELNRSRTVERAVLQMQAVVDQVLVDTQESEYPVKKPDQQTTSETPDIEVTSDGGVNRTSDPNKPTSFLPAPHPSESASPKDRLRYVNALASPPRWHLESELAYAWASVGSLVSALEIFKRLRLWPEVALCLASTAVSDGQGGRGAGGEEKARAIVRWRLFHRTLDSASTTDDDDLDRAGFDLSSLKASDFYGPERLPPPPNAPRLFCILGDIENDPQHYRRAWEISNCRFARAQRSLGELHLRKGEWHEAREAYILAVRVNRLSPELWNRLGDIELRLGLFADAAESFQRAISTANDTSGGEDARTWSNLGSALLSWYREMLQEGKVQQERIKNGHDADDVLDDMVSTKRAAGLGKTASELVRDSLIAYKRGATVADSNWKIWDNVITLAASLSPEPDFDGVILGLRNIIRIRKTEEALDLDILTLLVREATKDTIPVGEDSQEIYEPQRGTIASKVVTLLENDIVPVITSNSECWALISRVRAWKHDWAGALDAAEKGWRAAFGGGGMGNTLSASSDAQSQKGNWLTDTEAWDSVVQRTSELVAAYENYGSRLETIGAKWKGKARSAIRSVLGKAKESWEGDERWRTLHSMMEDLR
ncbi:hypothetical protein F5X99DRAFT_401555 [Biscogniauxia marginata]|nr:hypothetical protein F5X99DRAFT_401555 [Biscogniauxia marginata]